MPDIDIKNYPLNLPTDLPLALFPVRLETRFVYEDGQKKELLVRIYPDTVHIDSFEPGLTETEITLGKHFWEQTWLAGNDEARERSAWAQLATQFGPARAAWIARKLEPTNLTNWPHKPINNGIMPIIPIWPEFATRTEAWSRAPHTEILPDKWIVLGYKKNQTEPIFAEESKEIKRPLAVGISPQTGLNADNLGQDTEAGWLVNFNQAEKTGMGLRIPLTDESKDLDRLVVLGVQASSGEDGRKILEDLLNAHHYAHGLSFLSQGTPTNNTDDAPSGYSTLDPGFENSYRTERKTATISAHEDEKDTNGAITARALGIDAIIFDHTREATASEQIGAQSMNGALWQASWGYFLEQMMTGTEADSSAPSEEQISQARAHFECYVRARGPLPALRIGKQPYGLLPVASFEHWKAWDGESMDAILANFLCKLREVWHRSLANVPKVPGGSGTDETLLRILAMTPTSVNCAQRPAQRIALISSPPSDEALKAGNQTSKKLAEELGLSWIPRQLRMIYGSQSTVSQWAKGLVTPSKDTSLETKRYAFCDYLITKSYVDIQQHALNSKYDSLFDWLLQEACLREYVAAASRILQPPLNERLESEWEEEERPRLWELLARPVPFPANNAEDPRVKLYKEGLDNPALFSVTIPIKMGDYLDSLKQYLRREKFKKELQEVLDEWVAENKMSPDDAKKLAYELSEFASFFKNLHYIAAQPTSMLENLLLETLDLCSHRYDAWMTSFATKRLDKIREKKPTGIYFGGYGWVENLKEDTRESHGYIHAPSLAHATTAALLRSGYVSRSETDRQALAINLSSERVRMAHWLLDGVRQGQPLSALLGYRFERGLHENHPGVPLDKYPLDKYILPFRRIAQIQPQSDTQVVDGLTLLHKWQKDWEKKIPWGETTLPKLDDLDEKVRNAVITACQKEMERLEDAVDAIGDLVIAESVHQVAQGNPVRAGATLTAITEGEAPPPELDVIRTPRTGIALTHRLAVVFSAAQSPDKPFWAKEITVRAQTEPSLNAWAAGLFGPEAADAACLVEYSIPDLTNAEKKLTKTIKITFRDLKIEPIDLLYLPESEGDVQHSEIERRVIYAAQRKKDNAGKLIIPANAEISKLMFDHDREMPADVLTFAKVLEVARAIHKLITNARALSARDFAQPDQPIKPDEDVIVNDLKSRADNAVNTLNNAKKALDAALSAAKDKIILLEQALLKLANFGLPSAVPLAPADKTLEILTILQSQAESVNNEVVERLERVKAVDADRNLERSKHLKRLYEILGSEFQIDDTSKLPILLQSKSESEKREVAEHLKQITALDVDYHLARLHEVFGSEFHILPHFNPVNRADLQTSFNASDKLQKGDPLASVTWFQRISRVRESAARLDAALMYAEVLGDNELKFTVGQLPYNPNESWAALPFQEDLPGSRLSLVVHTPLNLAETLGSEDPLSGLMIDEWVEVVPNKQEMTGLTFHFDAPQSRAPQAILLAVPPDDSQQWNLAMLEATLRETLELAKLRLVDLTALGEVGQFLPALYMSRSRAPKEEKNT